jgi:hypothetical protein
VWHPAPCLVNCPQRTGVHAEIAEESTSGKHMSLWDTLFLS